MTDFYASYSVVAHTPDLGVVSMGPYPTAIEGYATDEEARAAMDAAFTGMAQYFIDSHAAERTSVRRFEGEDTVGDTVFTYPGPFG